MPLMEVWTCSAVPLAEETTKRITIYNYLYRGVIFFVVFLNQLSWNFDYLASTHLHYASPLPSVAADSCVLRIHVASTE